MSGGTADPRARLEAVLAPDVVEALEQLVAEMVRTQLGSAVAASANGGARWLTLKQAAERLGCTPDAVRMRVKRGRLEHRRQGRRLYVSAVAVDRLA